MSDKIGKEVKVIAVKQPLDYTLACNVEFPKTDASEKYMVNLKLEVVDGGKAIPDESDKVDLDAMIQTYKDQCGMELAKKLIKQGLAVPDDFKDKCDADFDGTVIPETTQDRANAAVAAKAKADALKAAYGIDPSQELTDEQVELIIKDYIQNNLEKFVSSPASTPDAGGNE